MSWLFTQTVLKAKVTFVILRAVNFELCWSVSQMSYYVSEILPLES